MQKILLFCIFITSFYSGSSQKIVRVIPKVIDSVLLNPGIGFMTFQRFNGDTLNSGLGWTEGLPIAYQNFNGDLSNKDYPETSIAYFRIYWRYLEPEEGKFNWHLIDKALETANERGQKLMLRVAPYGSGPVRNNTDVPNWYRNMVGDRNEWLDNTTGGGWRVDQFDPRYAEYFGRLISEMGDRYDGNPALESVDLAFSGFWGEGSGSDILTQEIRNRLIDAYTDHFKQTPLLIMLTDKESERYALSKANIGWRADCLGDMGGFNFPGTPEGWSHMIDVYPERINNGSGLDSAWKRGPVSFEVCWVIKKWEEEGWDINYIIEQSLKWHISSFNAKSSAVPKKWWPQINDWLKRMGYRFALRKFTFSESVGDDKKVDFTSWWENQGVAPVYDKNILFAIRLVNRTNSLIRITDAKVTDWLPGDNLFNGSFFIPYNLPKGVYNIETGLINKQTLSPVIKLAIEGRNTEGWYPMGKIEVK